MHRLLHHLLRAPGSAPPRRAPRRCAHSRVCARAARQKHLSDASEEVAKTERLQAFTNAKASKPTPTKIGPSESEHTAAAMQTEEEARAKLREVAAIYAAILVKHTNYANTQQARPSPTTAAPATAKAARHGSGPQSFALCVGGRCGRSASFSRRCTTSPRVCSSRSMTASGGTRSRTSSAASSAPSTSTSPCARMTSTPPSRAPSAYPLFHATPPSLYRALPSIEPPLRCSHLPSPTLQRPEFSAPSALVQDAVQGDVRAQAEGRPAPAARQGPAPPRVTRARGLRRLPQGPPGARSLA